MDSSCISSWQVLANFFNALLSSKVHWYQIIAPICDEPQHLLIRSTFPLLLNLFSLDDNFTSDFTEISTFHRLYAFFKVVPPPYTAFEEFYRSSGQQHKQINTISKPVFVNLLRSPGIDSQPVGPVRQPYLSYWLAMLHSLAESNPRNRFLVSLNVYNGLWSPLLSTPQ